MLLQVCNQFANILSTAAEAPLTRTRADALIMSAEGQKLQIQMNIQMLAMMKAMADNK
jgi:hypothetical protein